MDDLEHILSSEEHLSPPSRFATSVMEAVEAAAAESPPFPFPWHLYVSGVVGCIAWAAVSSWLIEIVAESAPRVVITLSAFGAPLEGAALGVSGCLVIVAMHRIRAELWDGEA
jgi:hypothetical protein